jgi:hypothetical protein
VSRWKGFSGARCGKLQLKGPLHEDVAVSSCRRCKHYYVTWDKGFPHGCRVIGFKSKSSPALMVRKISGMACLYFSEKKAESRG